MKEEQKYNGSKTRNYFTAYLLASIRGKRLRYLEKQQKILFAEENLEDKEYTDADISPEERLELEQKEQLLMEEAQGIYPEWNEMTDISLIEAMFSLQEEERKLIYQHVFEERTFKEIVKIQGKNLLELNDEQLTIFRRRNIGFIFQNYNLLPMLNVYENIVLPIELDGKSVDQEFLKEIISILGLEERINSMPNMLSGGQQQRVAIARALITKPAIILADEPTGNLDSRTSQDVLELIQNTSRRFEQTVVMITHNEHIAGLTERIVQIEDGKFLRTGADRNEKYSK